VRLLALVLLCACSFDHAAPASQQDAPTATSDGPNAKLDAAPTDARPVDTGNVDGCAAAPPGCTAFSCSGSSSCYYFCGGSSPSAQRSWFGARDACAPSLGCLVTINSQAEHECIVAQTNPVYPDNVWIGLRQTMNASEPSGGWGWECGTTAYSAWAQNEPNDINGGEDCGILATGGDFNDATCFRDARYVCELP
jgi:hypothetical protein